MKTAAIAFLLLVIALVVQPTPALRAAAGDGDPSTLIALNQLAKWTKDFPATNWDVLSDFDYIFPRPGGKLSERKLVVPAAVQKMNGQKVSIKGYMIPIPKRSEFLRNLTKAAKSSPPPARMRREKPKD